MRNERRWDEGDGWGGKRGCGWNERRWKEDLDGEYRIKRKGRKKDEDRRIKGKEDYGKYMGKMVWEMKRGNERNRKVEGRKGRKWFRCCRNKYRKRLGRKEEGFYERDRNKKNEDE